MFVVGGCGPSKGQIKCETNVAHRGLVSISTSAQQVKQALEGAVLFSAKPLPSRAIGTIGDGEADLRGAAAARSREARRSAVRFFVQLPSQRLAPLVGVGLLWGEKTHVSGVSGTIG